MPQRQNICLSVVICNKLETMTAFRFWQHTIKTLYILTGPSATLMCCGDKFSMYARTLAPGCGWLSGVWGVLLLWLSTQIWMSNEATNTVVMDTDWAQGIRRMALFVHGIMKGKYRRCVHWIWFGNGDGFFVFLFVLQGWWMRRAVEVE